MSKTYRRQRGSRKRKNNFSVLNLLLLTIYTVLSSYLIFLIFAYNMLGFRSLNLIIALVLGVIFLISLVLLLSKRAGKTLTTLLLLVSLVLAIGTYFAQSVVNVGNSFNRSARLSQVEMAIAVAKDSPIESLTDLTSVLAPETDSENVSLFLNKIQETESLSLIPASVATYQEAYETILADYGQAMVLNSGFSSVLEAEDSEFSDKIKIIYSTVIEKEINVERTATSDDVFNIYISGIDSFGAVSTVSRSDVNLIMTVNRKTNKILITTTPRDSYVPIAGGGNNQYDKLTHAGIYGIDASIGTLENLYGIQIDYYARLNFTSFLQLIDLVGGVEVYNDQEFTSLHGGYYFPVGNVSLNADQALGFVRERYSLRDGDNDRGKNQEKVLAALIKKLTSVNSLANYSTIIDGIGESVQTNIPLTTLMNLANAQLESNKEFEIISQALEGTGSTGQLTSYAMPNASLYMFSIDNNSLAAAKTAINDVMEGK